MLRQVDLVSSKIRVPQGPPTRPRPEEAEGKNPPTRNGGDSRIGGGSGGRKNGIRAIAAIQKIRFRKKCEKNNVYAISAWIFQNSPVFKNEESIFNWFPLESSKLCPEFYRSSENEIIKSIESIQGSRKSSMFIYDSGSLSSASSIRCMWRRDIAAHNVCKKALCLAWFWLYSYQCFGILWKSALYKGQPHISVSTRLEEGKKKIVAKSWKTIVTLEYLISPYESMPRRMQSVRSRDAREGYKKYSISWFNLTYIS